VYHGIEMPDERTKIGKAEVGVVTLSLVADGDTVKVKLSDNGQGIDTNKIREKCIAQGLLSGADLDNKQKLIHTIFAAGFSTAETADMHAGRGVGLNLVYDRVKELGGKVGVQTTVGKGTTFTLSIPLQDAIVP
jgi:two-component system chemotaxis sensor kinase CheA